MILIEKQSEPEEWKKIRRSPNPDFNSADKTALRKSLLQEQGYLCAYCMRRIRDDGKTPIRIEHYEARNPENTFDYKNLLAVCSGGERKNEKNDPERYTCDKKKQNGKLTIDPQNKADMETISYDLRGRIISNNKQFQKELDEVLNLNDSNGYLIRNRAAAISPIRTKLSKCGPGQDVLLMLNKWKEKFSKKNDSGEYEEYVGIIRWYIERSIRHHSHKKK